MKVVCVVKPTTITKPAAAAQAPKVKPAMGTLLAATAAVAILTSSGPALADSRRLTGFFDALAHSPRPAEVSRSNPVRGLGTSSGTDPSLNLPSLGGSDVASNIRAGGKDIVSKAKGAIEEGQAKAGKAVRSLQNQ